MKKKTIHNCALDNQALADSAPLTKTRLRRGEISHQKNISPHGFEEGGLAPTADDDIVDFLSGLSGEPPQA
ncbi:hypothetical protein FJY63_11365 [Candidatus Sumerlaeota bacterium]|nr:hypothetical protein [Candidatus Sumerlaeota bacterium]